MQGIRYTKKGSRQAGLSLIELMIATVVGLILIAGVLSIFLSSRKSYGINSAVGQVQENGRAALNFIRVNARMAGYLGCGTSATQFVNQIQPPPGSAALPYDFGNAITGFEYTGTGPGNSYVVPASMPAASQASWAPNLSTGIPTAMAAGQRAVPGSDIFAVSISQGTTTPSYVTSVNPDGQHFNVAANNNGLAAGDLMIISNCVYTAVREATSVAGSAIATQTVGLNSGVLPTAVANNAQVTVASVLAYYVGIGTDGSPALFEAVTDPAQTNGFRSEEVAPGVENMQVLYGVDTTGNGENPTQYVTADNVGDWNNVVSVRVALLLRSAPGAVPIPTTAQTYDLLGTTITAPRDTRLRQVFTTTVGLRNRIQRP